MIDKKQLNEPPGRHPAFNMNKAKKTLFLLLAVSCLMVQSLAYSAETPLVLVDNVNVDFVTGESLILGSQGVAVTVTSGTLEGTGLHIELYEDRGKMQWTSQADCILRVSEEGEDEFIIAVSRGLRRKLTDHAWELQYYGVGQVKAFSWNWQTTVILDYTVHGLGLIGLALMVYSPIHAINNYRKMGLGYDFIESITWVLAFALIGIGLFYGWVTG